MAGGKNHHQTPAHTSIKAPADDVISAWFEKNKDKYRAPEYRKFVYVALAPKDIADPSTIDDAAVREDYEKNKDKYRTAESRTIEQLTFSDRKAADEAATKLASGTTFDALVAEQGKTATDVLLGDFSKTTMPDQTLAEAAFAIAADGGTSAVIDGTFGPDGGLLSGKWERRDAAGDWQSWMKIELKRAY